MTYYDNTSLFDINSATGIINDTSAENEVGSYSINIICGDGTSNTSQTFVYTINDATNPVTTLVSPASGYTNSNVASPISLTFECNATDNYLLKNISLYLTSPNNQNFISNQSANISGTVNSSNWTVTLGTGTYTWNCLAYDNATLSDWGDSNRSFVLSYDSGSPSSPPGGGGGGGGKSDEEEISTNVTAIDECSADSDCDEGLSCWNRRCVKLFDVKLIRVDSPIEPGQVLDFTYLIKGMAEINGDVTVDFWFEKEGKVITSGSDTIYFGTFEEKTETTNIFIPEGTSLGTGEFYVQASYGNYKAKAHRTIQLGYGANVDINLLEPLMAELDMPFNFSFILGSNKDEPLAVRLEEKLRRNNEIIWEKQTELLLNKSKIFEEGVGVLTDGNYQLEIVGYYENKSSSFFQEFNIDEMTPVGAAFYAGQNPLYNNLMYILIGIACLILILLTYIIMFHFKHKTKIINTRLNRKIRQKR